MLGTGTKSEVEEISKGINGGRGDQQEWNKLRTPRTSLWKRLVHSDFCECWTQDKDLNQPGE